MALAFDVEKKRLDKALEVGADFALDSNKCDIVREVKNLTPSTIGHPAGFGPEAIVICARQGNVLNLALEMGMQGAKIIVAGFIPKTEIDPELLILKQLTVSGVLAGRFGENRNNGARTLKLLANQQMHPRGLISDTMPFKAIQKALDSTTRGENLAILLRP